MRVAIDASQIVYGTGVATYTKNLIENMVVRADDIEFTVYAGSIRQRSILKKWYNRLPENLEKKLFYFSPAISDLLWNKIHLISIDPFIGKHDILHTSDWSEPTSRSLKITTIHDLAPIKFPEYTHPKIVSVHQRRLKWVKKESNAIIVPSESTKGDLIDLGFEEKLIYVVPEASGLIKTKASTEQVLEVKSKYNITKPFLLSVGIGPRKNTSRIISAFSKLKKDMQLVITGRSIIEYEKKQDVIFVGHVSDNDLSSLYSGAQALVYPALYEGFGIPILDAFTVGCPVLTSNVSSMPEVAGESAILVNPLSTDDILTGIKKCLDNRESLIKKGYKEAQKYSWKITAEKTISLYKDLKS